MTLEENLPLVAVSSCLLGEKVRYNGTDKFCSTVAELAGQIRLLPLCPEVAIDLGIPRTPIRLIGFEAGVRARGVEDHWM